MTWLWIVAIALVLYGLAKVFPIVAAVWVMRKMTYCCLQMEPITRTDLSATQRKIFTPKIKEVQHYGFKSVGCWQLTVMPDQTMQGVLMRHKSGHTYALLHIQLPFNHEIPVTLNIATLFEDGASLETSNTPVSTIFSRPQEHRVLRLGDVSVKDLLNTHRQEYLAIKHSVQPRSLDPKDFIAAQLQQARDQIDYAHAQKEIQWLEPGQTYRFTLAHTIKVVREMAHQMAQNPGPPPQLSDEIPDTIPDSTLADHQTTHPPSSDGVDLQTPVGQTPVAQTPVAQTPVDKDVAAFMRSNHPSQSSPSRRNRTFILLASLAFFLVATPSMLGGNLQWQGVMAFAGVIAIHEAGHALAMKTFGYRDTTVLFVPFFGALATAKKDDATLTEKVWISLAGPLPGLGLGIGLAIARSQGWIPDLEWIDQTIGFFLFLNLFNLIPIYPLDGGQVANHLLFSRNPYWGVVFQSIGIGALALLGLGTGHFLLLGFAALVALSIPQTFRTAKLNAQFRNELLSSYPVIPSPSDPESPDSSTAELDTEAWIRRIFTALQSSPYGHLTFAQKSVLTKSLLDSRIEQMAPLTTRIGLSGIYIVSLMLGSIGSVYALSLGPADSMLANTANSSPPPIEADEDYFDRFYDEEFAEYNTTYFSDYEADVSYRYTCPTSQPPSLIVEAEKGDVMRDRQITLIATFETEAIAQSVLTTLQPLLIPSDHALAFGQSVLVATVSQRTQSQFESVTTSQGGTLFPADNLDYGVSIYIDAEAPDEQAAKQVAQTFWFFETIGMYDVSYVPPMPWESIALDPEQQALSQRAKYTYRRLKRVEEETWGTTPIKGYLWKSILATITRNPQWITDEQKKMMENQIKGVRNGINELLESNDPLLDPETLTLYLQQANLQHELNLLQMDDIWPQQSDGELEEGEPEQGKRSTSDDASAQDQEQLQATLYDVHQRLGQRIWQTSSRYAQDDAAADLTTLEYDNSRPWFNGYVQYDGTEVHFKALNFSSVSEMLPEMVEYLCDRQFTNIRYTFVDGAEIWDY